MKELYTHILKTGDTIVIKTDMPDVEVQKLTTFPNQHKFHSHFQSQGYRLEVESIFKKSPHLLKKKSSYFQASGGVTSFALTSQVVQMTEWTPDVVERRQFQLLQLLIKTWNLE